MSPLALLLSTLAFALGSGPTPAPDSAPSRLAETPTLHVCNCWESVEGDQPNRNRGVIQYRGYAADANDQCARRLGRPAFSAGCFGSLAEYRAATRGGMGANEITFRWWKNGSSNPPSCVRGYIPDGYTPGGRWVDTCGGSRHRGGR